MISQEYLKERLHYDPATGVFTWKPRENNIKAWNERRAGTEAGNVNTHKSGYTAVSIRINYKSYLASRLAWLYMTGAWPNECIDHINHDSTDNRFANLREATRRENSRNQSKARDNTSGITGVYWHKPRCKWYVRIKAGGKHLYGGLFESLEDAVARRKELEVLHDFHANHGAPRAA